MCFRQRLRRAATRLADSDGGETPPVRTDGGESDADDEDERGADGSGGDGSEADGTDGETDDTDGDGSEGAPGVDRAGVDVTEAGDAEPADPKWERPDVEDVPAFEIRADRPAASGSRENASREPGGRDVGDDPTAGRPNTARSPGQSRIKREGTEGYVAALELCARLPEDVRLPEQAADLVPAAVEAELEEDVRQFAVAEFDDPDPLVDELSFVEADGEIWLRIRLGVPPAAFGDLDPDEIRSHALQELEGLF